eukprot:TRINITY_DN11918_c0_g1_i2.p1 TRINITY_DN11918_c0_g1~~TRINITY_DN11918_c0_g1_i2.p1  ORF type:complete len:293 (-),score=34.94 TRINITY_DN11918_c0_g1_i2:236-1114(-)
MARFCFLALVSSSAFAAVKGGPCDIYNSGETPCVAAHSTVRALYQNYTGPLYELWRKSDDARKAIGTISPTGVADSSAQDLFCAADHCIISRIFDQSGRSNHLDIAPGGGEVHVADKGVNASRLKIQVGGHVAYGAYFEGGMGYRIDTTSAVPKDDEAETIYMVVDGKHYNSGCCFDYGNAETDNDDDGPGAMEAIYFGSFNASRGGWSGGVGAGPWVMADLEDGLWAGSELPYSKTNVPIEANFATAMLKGSAHSFELKAGDAQGGRLRTLYEGPRPPKYGTMRKQGVNPC